MRDDFEQLRWTAAGPVYGLTDGPALPPPLMTSPLEQPAMPTYRSFWPRALPDTGKVQIVTVENHVLVVLDTLSPHRTVDLARALLNAAGEAETGLRHRRRAP